MGVGWGGGEIASTQRVRFYIVWGDVIVFKNVKE